MGLFDELAERAQAVRWRIFAAGLPPAARPRHDRYDGFLPLEEAAETMRVSVVELVRMIDRGEVEAREFGGELRVLPAIISKLAVRTPARIV